MLDKMAIKEYIIFNYPFSQNIFTHSGHFSCEKIKYDYDGVPINEAVHHLDTLFTELMFKLKDSKPSDTIYGLGLSGGIGK